jgi:hypothetical protein
MLDNYFRASKMLDYLRSGPSGPHLDGFAAALRRQGYTDDTAVRYVRAAAHLGHVLAGCGGLPHDIDLQALSEHLRTCRCPRAKAAVTITIQSMAPGSFAGTSSKSACVAPPQ